MIDLSIIEPDLGQIAQGDRLASDDWQLDTDGLEHRGTGYFIARDALAARRNDGLWEWPLHLAEKSWCAPRSFREAFLAALDHFGIERDASLPKSFAVAFGIGTGTRTSSAQTDFVALGDLVRPKPVERKRPAAIEPRSAARGRITERNRMAVGARA